MQWVAAAKENKNAYAHHFLPRFSSLSCSHGTRRSARSSLRLAQIAITRLENVSTTINETVVSFRNQTFNYTLTVTGMDKPQSVEMAPAGDFVYVVSETSDSVVYYKRNKVSGKLSWVDQVP